MIEYLNPREKKNRHMDEEIKPDRAFSVAIPRESIKQPSQPMSVFKKVRTEIRVLRDQRTIELSLGPCWILIKKIFN